MWKSSQVVEKSSMVDTDEMWIECEIANEIHTYQSWFRLVVENDDNIQ